MPPRSDPDAGPGVLLVEDRAPVRVLRMNRPEKLNALNAALTQALCDELRAADADRSVRAVVLAGEGRAFSAGADTTEFAQLTANDLEAVLERAELTSELQSLPQRLSKPIVSAVQGPALGGGAGLALGCDMVVAASDLELGYPEMKHSLVPAIVMAGLQRHLGRKLAFEMISTGRILSAAEAAQYGLVNRVVEPAIVLETAVEIAEQWVQANPMAMSATKSLFYRVAELSASEAMRAGRDVNVIMRGFRS